VRRIGLIEDRPFNQKLFRQAFIRAGSFEVFAAAGVEEWLGMSASCDVDVIVISYHAGQSAHDLRTMIVTLFLLQDRPITILADRGLIDADFVAWAFEQGVSGYFTTDVPLPAAVHVLHLVGTSDEPRRPPYSSSTGSVSAVRSEEATSDRADALAIEAALSL